ncbi:hypothetical protein [Pleomorphomonas sp. JP5]|uniref:hypothetical protein n=1 Tax=Pleomorphomonas sp. JP5 TaxID=2942998 RepID=UPI0020444E75|nr:hypothetical protein [Pleomorphomonas sp. JP5]MCM5559307.1 hypothetical protein [Pleomorphomonas sp. JP5]
MSEIIAWLVAHESLSGWAQFFGAMLALIVTYITAFAPHWQRRRQMRQAAERLLLNGFEVLESYHRTSAYFLPTALSIRAAGLTMITVANEIDRFPIFELPGQGPRSMARSLVAVAGQLKLVSFALEPFAIQLDSRDGTAEDQETIRAFVGDQMKLVEAVIAGRELKRPEWFAPNGNVGGTPAKTNN